MVKDVDNTLNQLSIVLIDQPKLGNVITSQTPRLSYNSPVLKTGLDQFYVVFSDGINQSKSIPFIIRVLSKKRNPLDTELNNSKNTQDTGGNDDLYFLEIIDKNKDNEKKIKFEYKNTDFEEGDMITSYIEHQIEKKLILKLKEK